MERERTRALFSAKMTTLGEMAAGIAHEVNNPLGIIQGNATVLRALAEKAPASDTASILGAAQKIESSVQRIAKIIQSLRGIARNAEGDPFVRMALRPIIEELREVMNTRFKHRSIRFDCDAGAEGIEIEGRSVQITQVLMSLLENASQALETDSGQKEKRVMLGVELKNGRVCAFVEDNGPGIPAHLQEQVFQPFYSTKEKGRGAGLGLSVARSIAKDHQGELRVESTPGRTRLVLDLPLYKQNQSVAV